MTSKSLLFCFLAPLLFVAFGQIIVGVGILAKPDTEQADKKKQDEKDKVRELHWIDQMLGAPAPEKPKKDEKEKKKEEGGKDRFSPTSAYVFAGLFALLYVIGRILEDRLIRRRFLRSLSGG